MASRAAGFVSAGVLAVHLVPAIAAIVMLPGGFALDDIHAWSNTVIPVVSMAAVVVALIVLVWRRTTAFARIVVAAAAGGWLAAVVTGLALYPVSITLARVAVPALVALLVLALAWWARERTVRSLAAFVFGGALGVVVIVAQRAPLPSTHPRGGALADVRGEPSSQGSDQVVVPCGKHSLYLRPLLTFTSRSPDRTWTVLADGHGSRRTPRRYTQTTTGFAAAFTDDGDSTLVVNGDHIEAITTLREPVYSHLNAFTTIDVPFEATVSFGPTAQQRFLIEPADYPTGRPVQLAYLDADLGFHVVRARDAEKGPFSELASGRLARGESLSLELRPRDDSDPGCRLIFEDWSSQVSTEPSPTAGWGVAQGSIQFFSGFVLLTLADTGPGRGFDSVGHAAGTYRNRIRVEAIR